MISLEILYLAQVLKTATDSVSKGNKKVTTASILKNLRYAPDFPSLEVISNLLTKWKYENAALKLTPENIPEIPLPFIAHITENGGKFVVVKELTKSSIIWFDGNHIQNHNYENFFKLWSGYVLLLEGNDLSGEPNYLKNRMLELAVNSRNIFLIILVFGTAIATLKLHPSTFLTYYSLHLLLSSTGLCLSALLVWFNTVGKDFDVNSFCKFGEHFDCHSNQRSPGALLFNMLPWSEVGLMYFFSLVVTIFISSVAPSTAENVSAIAWLDLGASLFLFYFIYHQLRERGKWCLLCIGVQVVLLVTITLDYFTLPFMLSGQVSWKILIVGVLVSITLGLVLFPLWYKYAEVALSQKELKRFLSYTPLFNERLNLEDALNLPENLPGLLLGAINTANVLTFITNPYCNPCIQAHRYVEEILALTPEIQVRIIAIAPTDIEKRTRKIVSHWIAMQEESNNFKHALKFWYDSENKNYENFAKRYPVEIRDNHVIQADRYSEWAEEFGLTTTPAFYLNGRRIPQPYQVQDLKYLINNL